MSQRRYRQWCNSNKFDSMLPEDTKKCKITEKQPSVTDHFAPESQDMRPVLYSDKALEVAALEWVISTNQVCQNLVYFFVLILITATANPSIQGRHIQEDARHHIPSQPQLGLVTSFTQAIKGTDSHDVQATVGCPAGLPHSLFLPSFCFFWPTDFLLGSHRNWRNQPDM